MLPIRGAATNPDPAETKEFDTMTNTSETAEKNDQGARAGREDDPAFRAGKAAAQNRWLLLILGAVTVLAGIAALAMPFFASIAAALLLGWVLITSGVVGLFAAFRRNEGWHIAAAFALALLAIVTGALVLVQPIAGILAITTLIIAYFAAAGVLRLYYGAKSFGDGGGWMVASGALSLLLAILLWFGLPFNAAWVPGVLLGLDLILWGALQIAFGMREGRRGGA